MRYCIFEDTHYSNFLPLDYFRPVYQLRCGITTLEEKLRHHLHIKSFSFQSRDYLSQYLIESNPGTAVNSYPAEDTWFINGRLIPDEAIIREIKSAKGEILLHNGNEVIAAQVNGANINRTTKGWEDSVDPAYFDFLPQKSVSTELVRYPWNLVHRNAEEIERDYVFFEKARKGKQISGKVYPGAHLINKKNIFLGKKSIVKPGAVLDAEKGVIVIDEGAVIMPNAVIEGPAYIGKNSIVKIGAKIYHGTSIGQYCKAGGEIEAAIIQSYSNKQHEGFLGHAYLGSWVNLGADTNGSDLKNNYSSIKVTLNGAQVDTCLQFVGLMMGDHSKTGINVMFDTGTIVGVACNIYGAGLPPKSIPSFSWGTGNSFVEYDPVKSLETAKIVMARRNIALTESYEKMFMHIHALSKKEKNT